MKFEIWTDNVWRGMLYGLLVPVFAYACLYFIYAVLDAAGIFSDVGMAEDFRTRTLGLIAICANLVFIQLLRRRYLSEAMRGMLIATMILVLVWFLRYGINILRA